MMSDSNMNALRHGHCGNGYESPTYRSWKAMKRRCGNPHYPKYEQIEYDPKWSRFDGFLLDMGERPDGTTLDRVDTTKGYFKDNCRWADRFTQNQNRQTVVLSRDHAAAIFRAKDNEESARSVAKRFGCSPCNVRDIWAGRSWGNLK